MSVNAGESSLQNNPAVNGTWDGLSHDSKELSSVLDKYLLFFCYVLLTVHLSIFILVINQLDAQTFVLQ